MSEDTIVVLSRMATPALNEHRRALATAIADLKAAQQNLSLIVNQNTLDKTPYLLTGQDTGEQERLRAARCAIEAIDRVRGIIITLPS